MILSKRAAYGGLAAGAVVALAVPFGLAFGQGNEPSNELGSEPSIKADVTGQHVTITTVCSMGGTQDPVVAPEVPLAMTDSPSADTVKYEGEAPGPGTYTATFQCGVEQKSYSTQFKIAGPDDQPGHQNDPSGPQDQQQHPPPENQNDPGPPDDQPGHQNDPSGPQHQQQPGHQTAPQQQQMPGAHPGGTGYGQAPGSAPQHGSSAKPGQPGHGSQVPKKPGGGVSTGGGAMASVFVP